MPSPATPLPGAAPEAMVAGHVSLDLTPALHAPVTLEPGRLTEVGAAALSTGGAVGNTGVALHRLGVPVRLMGRVGDDVFGRALLDLLDGQGPALADGMIVAPGEATSYTIIISPPGVPAFGRRRRPAPAGPTVEPGSGRPRRRPPVRPGHA